MYGCRRNTRPFLVIFLLIAIGLSLSCSDLDDDLVTAIGAGDTGKVRQLLDRGANPNALGADGQPVLWHATHLGDPGPEVTNVEVVQALLDAGADPNTRLYNTSVLEDAVLAQAFWGGNTEVVRMLLDAGADPNTLDEDNIPVLARAVQLHENETVGLLLDAGADPSTLDIDKVPLGRGRPHLVRAVEDGETEIVGLLLDEGADPNEYFYEYESVLVRAIKKGETEIVRMLLDAGADPTLHEGGKPALIAAIQYGETENSGGCCWMPVPIPAPSTREPDPFLPTANLSSTTPQEGRLSEKGKLKWYKS